MMGKKKTSNRISAKPWFCITDNSNYCYHSVHRKIGKKYFCLICNSVFDTILEPRFLQIIASNEEEKPKECNHDSMENT